MGTADLDSKITHELLARGRLAQLLKTEAEIELIGESDNGRDALAKIKKDSPALVFLDVQMPELDGFGVVAALSAEKLPAIVFVTAHDKFALKAFEVHAVDYLLKPFDRERFQTALRRAIDRLKQKQSNQLSTQLSALLADLKPESKFADRISVKSSGRIIFVKVEDLDWVEGADNYVSLHVGSETHLLRETMAAFEARLDPGKFTRISRSAIVNLERIKELQPLFHGEYVILLRDGTRLTLSRTYREKLDRILGKAS